MDTARVGQQLAPESGVFVTSIVCHESIIGQYNQYVRCRRQDQLFEDTFAVCGGVLLAGAIQFAFGLIVLNAAVDGQVASINSEVSSAIQQMRETTASMKRESEERSVRQQQANESQRRESTLGKKLARECNEFSQFYRDNPSAYAMRQSDKACNQYRHYINTGQVTR